jgi:hypothetical protein
MTSPIAELLLASGPIDAEVELFGRFVGAWTFDGTDIAEDGTEAEYSGRWDFGYVLGGRAVQDVLHCDGVEHGTTVRIPRGDGTWDVVWITPVQCAVRQLVGRAEGERIVIMGVSGERQLRWTFNDIARDSFVWRGEQSTDNGASFRLAEEMRLSRVG